TSPGLLGVRSSRIGYMQAALRLSAIGPSPGSPVLRLRIDGMRAGVAADTGIVLIVQAVIRQFVGVNIGPDHLLRPGGEWRQLNFLVFPVPADDGYRSALPGLVAAQPGDPGVVADQYLVERDRLAQSAAPIRVAFPQRRAISGGLLFDGLGGPDAHQIQVKAL